MLRARPLLLTLSLAIAHATPAVRAASQVEHEAASQPARQDYFRLRGGLDRAREVFERRHEGRVAFLGGSITYNPGWRERVCAYLRERFPETSFDFVAAGIPSTGSTPGAFRLERDVFGRGPVDLLFEEAAVNDSTNGRSELEQRRALEGLVRHARRLNAAIDIVLLHFVDPDKMRSYEQGLVPAVIRNHEAVAHHYGLPSLDLALEVTERIARGEFDWEHDFRDLHPSPFGQQVYARSIARLLDAAWPRGSAAAAGAAGLGEEEGGARDPEGGEPDAQEPGAPSLGASERPTRGLPEPLDPFCYERGQLRPPSAADTLEGFQLVPRWSNEVGGGTRAGFVDVPMLVGERAGASFALEFRGSAVGLFVAAGPDAGVLDFRVDAGEWRERDLFTPWSAGLHLPWLYVLEAELDPARAHRLECRIAERKSARSTGRACRIAHFAVNGD